MSSRQRTASQWAGSLGMTVEILALISLAGTLEISFHMFGIAAAALLISMFRKKPVGERWLVAGFAVIMAAAFVAWRLSKLHPVAVVAHATPITHGLLWFAGRTNRYRGWRLGMGLIEMVLASVLTAEAYLPLAIVVFVILGSVSLACNFLDYELQMRAPEYRGNPLPRRFIPSSIGLSFLIFMTAMLIFPLLPRTNATLSIFGDGLRMGYNEGVSVSSWRSFTNTSSGNTVLRLFPPEGVDLTMEIYLGLLRGRVLDSFDGRHWTPTPKKATHERAPASSRDFTAAHPIQVEVIREAIHSDILPIPYGTRDLKGGKRLQGGEWVEPRSWEQRTQYSFTLIPNDLTYLKAEASTDPVLPIHLNVPKDIDTERMRREAKKIFGNAKTAQDKIIRLMDYYSENRFSANVSATEAEEEPSKAAPRDRKKGYHPIEDFLFFRKMGHCEWFASTTAVLLRMAGVPTRLIAGFRVSKSQMTGLLSVHDADGHAWLEAYSPERGWMPVDPTPRIMVPGTITDMFREAYDWISAHWYRYVVAYTSVDFAKIKSTVLGEESSESLSEGWDTKVLSSIRDQKRVFILGIVGLLGLAAVVALVIRIWFPWVFSIRWRVSEGPPQLRRERVRVEKLLRARIAENSRREKILLGIYRDKGTRAGNALKEWYQAYDEARFGAKHDSESIARGVHDLRARYRELSKLVATIAAALMLFAGTPRTASAASLTANAFDIAEAPAWLKLARAEKVAAEIERRLEWDIRKIQVRFHSNDSAFRQAHGYSSPNMTVMAFTRPSDLSVHLGPAVSPENFDRIFGHELAHVIVRQKYRNTVPKWLEEGLANFVAQKKPSIDYAWLKSQPARDVRAMEHPFRSAGGSDAKFHYMASTALIVMINSKCKIDDLLQLSVGKGLESFLPTYCGISDINAEFRKWLQSRR